ncbi:DUF2029 domain-containing protein [Cytophagaceae bacterium SJW1-29]|uniref:DUF2029 domain-containing protein n=2 Tax=Salmonirosea aquatica TaxID=2654236 RepID=A0A7C9BGB2_9BACT|nr:DUF2029 domain-containing protein [Cytophagaceae bacterium SJW1-29]
MVAALFASAQSYLSDLKTFVEGGRLYTSYNNYIIFKQSFFHLLEGKDLYILHEEVQWDLFKYSPTFALLFGGLAVLPDFVGLALWNLLNALVLFYAIYFLPHLNNRTKGLILVFVLIELLTSLQNEQSNGLIAGLLIFTFGALEREKYWMASFCLVATIFIKLFGIVALALFLLYPNKLKLAYTTASWVLLFGLLPLLVVSFDQFVFLYKSWWYMLANDHSTSDGLSVVGWLKTWFGWEVNKTLISGVGACLFCLPLLRISQYGTYIFRIWLLASVLLWVVIFNHKAESPTFIIAVCGVALWYFSQVPKPENRVLLLLTFVFTILSATDIFPPSVRNEWFKPFVVKAIPCILVWVKITVDLLTNKENIQASLSKTT